MEGMINYRNKRNRITPWLNQYYATSGNVPSENVLNEIIQAELSQAYQDRMRQQQLALQREQLDAQKAMWDAQRGEWKSARKDRQQQALWGGLGQLGKMGISLLGRERLDRGLDWLGDKIGGGVDYAKGALGLGAPIDHAAATEKAWATLPGENPWEDMTRKSPDLYATTPLQPPEGSAIHGLRNSALTLGRTPATPAVSTPLQGKVPDVPNSATVDYTSKTPAEMQAIMDEYTSTNPNAGALFSKAPVSPMVLRQNQLKEAERKRREAQALQNSISYNEQLRQQALARNKRILESRNYGR